MVNIRIAKVRSEVMKKKTIFALLILLLFTCSAFAQPASPSSDIQALLGFYQSEGDNVIIREREGRLEFLYGVTVDDWPFNQSNVFQMRKKRYDEYELVTANPRDYRMILNVKFERDGKGKGITLVIDKQRYSRIFFAGENANDFKLTPSQPVDALRRNAEASIMPNQPGNLLAAKLVDISRKDSQIKINMVYATDKNFIDTAIYESNKAYLQEDAANALSRVNKELAKYGYGVVVWDAYRPWYISKLLHDVLPEKDKGLLESPETGSQHNRGLSVDVSLYYLATGQQVQMISGFDEPSLRAYSKFQGGSELERFRRDLLRQLMENEGFTTIDHEWWHFDYKDFTNYQLLNIPFNELDKE